MSAKIPYTYLTDHIGDFCVVYETPGFTPTKDGGKQHQLQVIIGLARKFKKNTLSGRIVLSKDLLIRIHSQLHPDQATMERWVQSHKAEFEALAEKAPEAKTRRMGERAGAMDAVTEEETLYYEWRYSFDESDGLGSLESGDELETPPVTASSIRQSADFHWRS